MHTLDRQRAEAPGRSPGRSRAARRAFTLLELTVSVLVIGILLGGMASAVIVASRAMPDRQTELLAGLDAGDVVEQFAGELRCAVSILSAGPRELTFTVPDRNSDSQPETIQYQWSGTVGDPLRRTYNGVAADVQPKVFTFELTYGSYLKTQAEPLPPVEGSETLLYSYDTIWNLTYGVVDTSRSFATCFQPSLPSNAVSWSVSRVALVLSQDNLATAKLRLRLALPDTNGHPTGTTVDTLSIDESSLPSFPSWRTFSFSAARNLAPGTPLCLEATLDTSGSGTTAARLLYRTTGVTPPTAVFREKISPGSWAIMSGTGQLIYVYGTITTPGGTQSVQYRQVTSIRIVLQAYADDGTRIETTVPLPNEPRATW